MRIKIEKTKYNVYERQSTMYVNKMVTRSVYRRLK